MRTADTVLGLIRDLREAAEPKEVVEFREVIKPRGKCQDSELGLAVCDSLW